MRVRGRLHYAEDGDLSRAEEQWEEDMRRAEVSAVALGHALPTDAHKAVYQLLVDILELMTTHQEDVPAPMRALIRTLKRMEGLALEELSKIPPDVLQTFVRSLGERMIAATEADTLALPAGERNAALEASFGPDDASPA